MRLLDLRYAKILNCPNLPHVPMLTGSLVAIVTPMSPDGALDFARLKSLIDWHVAEGTDGIVIVGTTTFIHIKVLLHVLFTVLISSIRLP